MYDNLPRSKVSSGGGGRCPRRFQELPGHGPCLLPRGWLGKDPGWHQTSWNMFQRSPTASTRNEGSPGCDKLHPAAAQTLNRSEGFGCDVCQGLKHARLFNSWLVERHVFASGGKTAPAFLGFFEYMHFRNLRHTRMLRHFLGWVGWGMLTFVRTCDTRACYVTSWVGWGGGCWRSWELATHTRSIRIWQWRRMNSKENILEKTGRMLDKRMCSWKGKKSARVFNTKILAIYRTMMLKPLDFPRENSRIFEMKVNSFAMAKTTFFQKRSKRWRGFPPDGMFLIVFIGNRGNKKVWAPGERLLYDFCTYSWVFTLQWLFCLNRISGKGFVSWVKGRISSH